MGLFPVIAGVMGIVELSMRLQPSLMLPLEACHYRGPISLIMINVQFKCITGFALYNRGYVWGYPQ